MSKVCQVTGKRPHRGYKYAIRGIAKKKKGIGLRNIVSRVKKIKGTLDIDSKRGQGTSIKILIPAKYTDVKTPEEPKLINA